MAVFFPARIAQVRNVIAEKWPSLVKIVLEAGADTPHESLGLRPPWSPLQAEPHPVGIEWFLFTVGEA